MQAHEDDVGRREGVCAFAGIVAASQKQGVPIYEVDVGSADQRELAKLALKAIAEKIVRQAI